MGYPRLPIYVLTKADLAKQKEFTEKTFLELKNC